MSSSAGDPACMRTVRHGRVATCLDTVRSGRVLGVRLNLRRSSMTQARLGYAGLPLLKRPQGVSYKRDKNNIQARLCPKDQPQRVRLQQQRRNQFPAPVERSYVAAPGAGGLPPSLELWRTSRAAQDPSYAASPGNALRLVLRTPPLSGRRARMRRSGFERQALGFRHVIAPNSFDVFDTEPGVFDGH